MDVACITKYEEKIPELTPPALFALYRGTLTL